MIGIGFNHAGWPNYGRSAWQDMQNRRAGMARSLQQMQSAHNAINAAFASAQQNRIAGLAQLAVKAAISRIQDVQNAKVAEANKKLADAQAMFNQIQASRNANTTSTGTVLNQTA